MICFWCKKIIKKGQKVYGIYFMRFHAKCVQEIEKIVLGKAIDMGRAKQETK